MIFPRNEYALIVSEIGGNHGGNVDLALYMIDAAVEAGADAVKFQTYVTEHIVARTEPAYADFEREALSYDEFRLLADHCDRDAKRV